MAKGLRSKSRKFYASERRKEFGIPAQDAQIKEQSERLKESIDRQTNVTDLMNIKSLFQKNKQMMIERSNVDKTDQTNQSTRRQRTNVFVYTAGRTCKPTTTVKTKSRSNAISSKRNIATNKDSMEVEKPEEKKMPKTVRNTKHLRSKTKKSKLIF